MLVDLQSESKTQATTAMFSYFNARLKNKVVLRMCFWVVRREMPLSISSYC